MLPNDDFLQLLLHHLSVLCKFLQDISQALLIVRHDPSIPVNKVFSSSVSLNNIASCPAQFPSALLLANHIYRFALPRLSFIPKLILNHLDSYVIRVNALLNLTTRL